MKRIKFSDLLPNVKVDSKALSDVKGGGDYDVMPLDGCYTGICSVKINPEYCAGGAVCTSGIRGYDY